MATQKKRVKYTVSQARNLMRRSLNEILDPGPSSVDQLWSHFESSCAYCRTPLDRLQRHGHIDHATTGGGSQIGNLILACSRCNGDEKLDQDWPAFLLLKTAGDRVALAERTERIESWFAKHPIRPVVRRPDETPVAKTDAALAGDLMPSSADGPTVTTLTKRQPSSSNAFSAESTDHPRVGAVESK
jgi:5-methylcytosine-specific restriction endonuclease McrA